MAKCKNCCEYFILILFMFGIVGCIGACIYFFIDYEREWSLESYNCQIIDVTECVMYSNKVVYKYILSIPDCGNTTMISQDAIYDRVTCDQYVLKILNSTVSCVLDDCNIIYRQSKGYIFLPILMLFYSAILVFIFVCMSKRQDTVLGRLCKERRDKKMRDVEKTQNHNDNENEMVELEEIEL